MPFYRNRNFLLIVISVLFFVVLFSETPESKDRSLETVTSEGTSISISSEAFIKDLEDAYQNNCISGSRIMMESGETPRYRYEYIMRNGYNKIVSLTMPYRVTWYRYNDRGYLVLDGKRTLMEDMMKDLEDVFLEDLQRKPVEMKINEILYSGIPAYYVSVYGDNFTYRVIVLQQSMNFIRLEKQTHDRLTVMLYDNLNAGDKEAFDNQMVWYQEIPLGDTFKALQSSTETVDSESTSTTDQLSEKEELVRKFEQIIAPLVGPYSVQKTEVVKFSDADAMFIIFTSDELENPFVVSVVIYKSKQAQMSQNFFEDVPEDYNHFQKRKDNMEVNVIGAHKEAFLKSIAEMIIPDEE